LILEELIKKENKISDNNIDNSLIASIGSGIYKKKKRLGFDSAFA